MTIVKSIAPTGVCIITRHDTPSSAELERRSRVWCGHINITVLDAVAGDFPPVAPGTATLPRREHKAAHT